MCSSKLAWEVLLVIPVVLWHLLISFEWLVSYMTEEMEGQANIQNVHFGN